MDKSILNKTVRPYRDRPLETAQERFFSSVSKDGPNGCHQWTGAVTLRGYGHIGIRYKMYSTHRLAWLIAYGEIPDGLHVLHKCDNPPCVNPDHLFLGSHADNAADREMKGRGAALKGEQNGSAKLTEHQVRELRFNYPAMTQTKLAAMFGISQATVWNIVTRKSWRHVI